MSISRSHVLKGFESGYMNESVTEWSLYLYYFVAVTKNHELRPLQQQKFLVLQFWRLEVLDQGVSRVHSF